MQSCGVKIRGKKKKNTLGFLDSWVLIDRDWNWAEIEILDQLRLESSKSQDSKMLNFRNFGFYWTWTLILSWTWNGLQTHPRLTKIPINWLYFITVFQPSLMDTIVKLKDSNSGCWLQPKPHIIICHRVTYP